MTAEYRAIRLEEREECLDLWTRVFGDSRSYFDRYFTCDVDWLPYYTQVAVVGGHLVSAAHVCKRVVSCGNLRLTMGGVANVATLEAHRGQGHNTACMRRLIDVMEADSMDFALLGTGINGYYERLGFETAVTERFEGTLRQRANQVLGSLRVRAASGSDLADVRRIYAEYNRRRPIAVERTEAYWRDWIGADDRSLEADYLVCEDSAGSVVGYVCYALGGPSVFLRELGAADGSEMIADALIHAAAEIGRRAGASKLEAHIAFDPDVLRALESETDIQEWVAQRGAMARLLNRDNLIRWIVMDRSDEWTACGKPRGTLTFSTPFGPVGIDSTSERPRVATDGVGTPEHSQADLFRLVTGAVSPEEITEDSDLQRLIGALFPKRYPVYWSADGF